MPRPLPDPEKTSPPLPPKQEVVPIHREVMAVVQKADDLEVHTCKARMDGVTVLDIRDYVPSTGLYGRGTTLPWNTETIKVMRQAMRSATALVQGREAPSA